MKARDLFLMAGLRDPSEVVGERQQPAGELRF